MNIVELLAALLFYISFYSEVFCMAVYFFTYLLLQLLLLALRKIAKFCLCSISADLSASRCLRRVLFAVLRFCNSVYFLCLVSKWIIVTDIIYEIINHFRYTHIYIYFWLLVLKKREKCYGLLYLILLILKISSFVVCFYYLCTC